MEQFSHLKQSLRVKEDDVIAEGATSVLMILFVLIIAFVRSSSSEDYS